VDQTGVFNVLNFGSSALLGNAIASGHRRASNTCFRCLLNHAVTRIHGLRRQYWYQRVQGSWKAA